jgi:serine/threonine protein kinase
MLQVWKVLVVYTVVSKFVFGANKVGPLKPIDELAQKMVLEKAEKTKNLYTLKFSKYCQPFHPTELKVALPYTDGTLRSVPIIWDVVTSFDQSNIELGRGAFGVVKEVCFPFFMLDNAQFGMEFSDPRAGPIAIKRVKLDTLSIEEFELMYLLTQFDDAPRFYGCMYDEERENAFILQTRLQTSLRSATKLFQASENKQARWFIIKRLVIQSALIDRLGFTHNDIKPENVMLFNGGNKQAIIDYGLAQKKGTNLMCSGTPFYMRWTKCAQKTIAAFYAEDLYSVVVTIGTLESAKGKSPMFIPNPTDPLKPDTCENKHLNPNCRMHFHQAIMEILKQNYPELFKDRPEFDPKAPPKSVQAMDLLDVFSAVLSQENFVIDSEEVIKITNKFFTEVIKKTYPDISAPFVVYVPPETHSSCGYVNVMMELIQRIKSNTLKLPDKSKDWRASKKREGKTPNLFGLV